MRRRFSTLVKLDTHWYKRCTKCRELKLATSDNFYWHDGIWASWCKHCDKLFARDHKKARKYRVWSKRIGKPDTEGLYSLHGRR